MQYLDLNGNLFQMVGWIHLLQLITVYVFLEHEQVQFTAWMQKQVKME